MPDLYTPSSYSHTPSPIFDRPFFRRWSFALLFALLAGALCFLFRGVLSPASFLFGTDTVTHDYPCLRWAWDETLKSGRLPLWCPYLFCGLPTLGTALFCPFYPTQWLFAALPFPLAFTLQYYLAFLWAGLGAYALARRMECKPAAALIAGLAFGLSGHVISLAYAGHMQKVMAIAWLPWALAGWAAISEGKRWGILLAGFAVAMQLLASHPQIAYYTVCAGALTLLVNPQSIIHNLRSRLLYLFHSFAGSLVLAALLAGAQLLPMLEMSALSNRAQGVPFEEAAKTSFPPRELLEIALPRFSGDTVRGGYGQYFGAWGSEHERIVSDYTGAAVLLLALYGLFISRNRRRALWVTLWIGAALLALGKYTPAYELAYRLIPGISGFRSPATIMVLMALSSAMLAAIGLQRLLMHEKLGKEWRWAALWLGFACVALLIAQISRSYARGASANDPLSSSVVLWDSIRRFSFYLFLSCAAVAACFLSRHQHAAAVSKPLIIAGAGALLLACIADLVSAQKLFIQPEPAAKMEYALREVAPDSLLADRLPPARLQEMGNELCDRRMASHVASLAGYHPITFRQYHRLIETMGGFNHSRVLDAFAIDYLIGPAPQRAQPGWPPQGYEISREPAYQSPQGNKALYAASPAPALISQEDEETSSSGAAPHSHQIKWLSYSPDRLEFELTNAGDGAQRWILHEPYMAGWQASASDLRLKIKPDEKYHFFRQIESPAPISGKITMRYLPFSFRLGLFFSLMGWAIVIGGIVAIRTQRERPRPNEK
ncbi:MAG: hypothetical protein NTX50_25695 [Candidatus Sumerlaeota bacterium]|nr:hypothetical protein [Candidatus Sumerlaeota bacterium]